MKSNLAEKLISITGQKFIAIEKDDRPSYLSRSNMNRDFCSLFQFLSSL